MIILRRDPKGEMVFEKSNPSSAAVAEFSKWAEGSLPSPFQKKNRNISISFGPEKVEDPAKLQSKIKELEDALQERDRKIAKLEEKVCVHEWNLFVSRNTSILIHLLSAWFSWVTIIGLIAAMINFRNSQSQASCESTLLRMFIHAC